VVRDSDSRLRFCLFCENGGTGRAAKVTPYSGALDAAAAATPNSWPSANGRRHHDQGPAANLVFVRICVSHFIGQHEPRLLRPGHAHGTPPKRRQVSISRPPKLPEPARASLGLPKWLGTRPISSRLSFRSTREKKTAGGSFVRYFRWPRPPRLPATRNRGSGF